MYPRPMSGASAPEKVAEVRLCHVTSSHWVDDGRIFQRECRTLADAGYVVGVVGPGELPAYPGIHHLARIERHSGRLRRWARGMSQTWRAIGKCPANVYHFHDPELIPMAVALSLRGERVIWDAHEDYAERFSDRRSDSRLGSLGRRTAKGLTEALMTLMDRNASGVVAATPTIASRYRNANTVVVGNEARLEDFSKATPRFDNQEVLFTGTPSAAHLFPQVVQAVSESPDLTLVLARRDISEGMAAMARDLLGDRFVHVGFLRPHELADRMSKAVVGLCTYAPLPAYVDSTGSPTKFFEFAAAGLPVIGSPIPPVRRLMDECAAGVLADGFDAADFRRALTLVTSQEEYWRSQSGRLRAWARAGNSWRESEKAILAAYDRSLS